MKNLKYEKKINFGLEKIIVLINRNGISVNNKTLISIYMP